MRKQNNKTYTYVYSDIKTGWSHNTKPQIILGSPRAHLKEGQDPKIKIKI